MTKEIKASGINEAIGTIIAKLCYRASDEIGGNLAERTSEWRKSNAMVILSKAEEKYNNIAITGNEQAHPRLMHHIIEEGSWSDTTLVQEMWSGLLASSCTEDGDDESNLIFINILKQLSSTQVDILNYGCENAEIVMSDAGWIGSETLDIECNELVKITSIDDIHRLDRELDHLRSLDLIMGGFHPNNTTAEISPNPLAIQLYVRSQGYIGSPVEYFGLNEQKDS